MLYDKTEIKKFLMKELEEKYIIYTHSFNSYSHFHEINCIDEIRYGYDIVRIYNRINKTVLSNFYATPADSCFVVHSEKIPMSLNVLFLILREDKMSLKYFTKYKLEYL